MFDFQIHTTSSLIPCDLVIFSYIIRLCSRLTALWRYINIVLLLLLLYCVMYIKLFHEYIFIYSSWIYYIHIVVYSH